VCVCLLAFSCGYLSVLCCYLLSISCSILNIGLLGSMALSFICRLFLHNLCMWYFSRVFICFPFLCVFTMSMVSAMGPYLCPVFSMWFEYPELS
jgi:hypothetical protein